MRHNMVNIKPGNGLLRSVHIDPEVDKKLREIAYWSRISKADLMRLILELGLEDEDILNDCWCLC